MRRRAGIILIEDGKLALIERHRAKLHYFVFPGGGIDQGETPQQAAIREAEEELGIKVEIKQEIVKITSYQNKQHYFLAERLSGEFGTGIGEEYGEFNPKYGTYHPLWMPMVDVPNNNVLPDELAKLVVQFFHEGWPNTTVKIKK
jgi:8-oxo-dGTP diphosphatase